MLQETAEPTNLYSVQKVGKSVNTTAQEMEQVLGMYMHMGLVQMSTVRAFWDMEAKLPAVCDVMSRDPFLKLLTLIHFQDNLSVSDDAKNDKLWKLRPWLQKLREQVLCIPPEECHAVDEIMMPFKGKSHLRFYMPAKPHKWGFKMWGRAGQSGFLYDFDACQGAANPDREKSEVGVTGEVVLKMTSTLPVGKNHEVFADNYFTSVPLVQHLKERGIHYIGTIRMNRMKDCTMMGEKEMKKNGRGSMDLRVNQDNNIFVRWYDNKAVNLISSFVGIEPVGNVERWHRKSKTPIMGPRPAIVETYNKFMGGVDLLDAVCTLQVQLQIPKMVHVHLVAHCYSGSHQCVEPLQKRPEEARAPEETHGSANVSGFGWHLSHKCRKGQHQVWQTTILSRNDSNTTP